jgi:hypothetical protein
MAKRKPIQSTLVNENLLSDALYNTHPASRNTGSYNTGIYRATYGRGIVVGAVSALMSVGMDFEQAAYHIRKCLPQGFNHHCIPDPWKEEIMGDYKCPG